MNLTSTTSPAIRAPVTEFGLGNLGADGHPMVSTPVTRSGYLFEVVNAEVVRRGDAGDWPGCGGVGESITPEVPASALRVDTGWQMVDGRIFSLSVSDRARVVAGTVFG